MVSNQHSNQQIQTAVNQPECRTTNCRLSATFKQRSISTVLAHSMTHSHTDSPTRSLTEMHPYNRQRLLKTTQRHNTAMHNNQAPTHHQTRDTRQTRPTARTARTSNNSTTRCHPHSTNYVYIARSTTRTDGSLNLEHTGKRHYQLRHTQKTPHAPRTSSSSAQYQQLPPTYDKLSLELAALLDTIPQTTPHALHFYRRTRMYAACTLAHSLSDLCKETEALLPRLARVFETARLLTPSRNPSCLMNIATLSFTTHRASQSVTHAQSVCHEVTLYIHLCSPRSASVQTEHASQSAYRPRRSQLADRRTCGHK